MPNAQEVLEWMEWEKKRKANMTNEEWLRSCNTEQLVHVIHLMTSCCYVCGKDGVDYKRCYFHKKCTGPKEIEEWLKETHYHLKNDEK